MSATIRLPNITAQDYNGKLLQVQSYLYQLVQELNNALSSAEKDNAETAMIASQAAQKGWSEQDNVKNFNAIKALIIKSADIVNAYYDEISRRLEGQYVAQSEFGSYSEMTDQRITENLTGIERLYTNVQEILSSVDTIENQIISVNANIKTGLLYYDDSGAPVYGLEIGQRTEVDGYEVFNKYARFTSDRLSFYDANDNEVAYISDRKLFITDVHVTGSMQIGGFIDTVLPDLGIITKWIGG